MYSRAPGGQKPFLKKKKSSSVVCTRKFYSLNLLTVTRTVTDYSRDVMPRGFCQGEGFPWTRLPPKKILGQWFKYHTYFITTLVVISVEVSYYVLRANGEVSIVYARTDVRIVNYSIYRNDTSERL